MNSNTIISRSLCSLFPPLPGHKSYNKVYLNNKAHRRHFFFFKNLTRNRFLISQPYAEMLDPANELLPAPSSPTISSVSSSDLDTESTGSFFHDRSTTLGTLMGVSFPAIPFRAPSQHLDPHSAAAGSAAPLGGSRRGIKPNKKNRRAKVVDAAAVVAERRRRWWSLCRDGDTRPAASLGDFLEVERRFGDGAFYGTAAELEGMVMGQQRNSGRVLFANGRVLPPATDVDDGASTAGSLCNRFPVSLTGICSGGA